jgi:hypothetical protein
MRRRNVEKDDEQFERYLSEFQPRRPRALAEQVVSRQIWLQRLAAAATIALALGSSLWFEGRRSKWNGGEPIAKNTAALPVATAEPQPLFLLPLTQLALENPGQFDAELAKASRRVLPDFRGSESTLHVLAKE